MTKLAPNQAFPLLLASVLMTLPMALWEGWIFHHLSNWFLHPLGFMHLTTLQATGIMFVKAYIFLYVKSSMETPTDLYEYFGGLLGRVFVGFGVLLLGLLIRAFIS